MINDEWKHFSLSMCEITHGIAIDIISKSSNKIYLINKIRNQEDKNFLIMIFSYILILDFSFIHQIFQNQKK